MWYQFYKHKQANSLTIIVALANLASVVISFRDSKTERFTVTHLVQKAVIDPKKDTVELVGDPSMWELYRYDHKTLLSLQVLSVLAKKRQHKACTYILRRCLPVRYS